MLHEDGAVDLDPEIAVAQHPLDWYTPVATATINETISLPTGAISIGGIPRSPVIATLSPALLGITTSASMGSSSSLGTSLGATSPLAISAYQSTYPGTYTYSVNSAGLPLLTSRADGLGLKIFLDFDGYNTDTAFSTDADLTTFNASEQLNIVETWRDIVSYFAPFNVNVTTVQPATGGSNPVFVWQRIVSNLTGGAAYVGWLTNNSSQGYDNSGDAVSRHSGIAHEIGHQLGLNHQSEYDILGNKTAEYTDGFGNLDRAIMGIDYADVVRNYIYGRDAISATNLIDSYNVIAGTVTGVVGGDGYLSDDYGNTIATATPIPASGTVDGVIERATDADVFSFTSTGATYQIAATPTFEAGTSPKIELLDSGGNIIASRDDADQRNQNNNAQEFSLTLPAGTYFVRVSSSGDYAEQGEYVLTVAPLLSGWTTQDVQQVWRGGTAAYNPSTNTLTQMGGGTDIWGTSDQFRFTSQILNGDGSITTRIDSLDNTDAVAKAGVMIRQSLASGSQHVYFGIVPSGQLETIQRTTSGGTATNVVSTTGQVGPWVRLSRVGNTFTLSKSTDGVTWTVVATTSVSMTNPVYIGFATNSRTARRAAWSTFSNITVTGNLGAAAPTYNSLPAPTGLLAAPAAGGNTSVVLNWTDTAAESGYAIDRSVDGVNYTQIATVAANVVTYTDAGLFGSMRYYYRVAATDATSARSVNSSAVSVVNKPQAVANPNATYALPYIALSTTQILLNWADVQGDEGYKVERSTDGGATYTVVTTRPKNYNAFNDSGLAAGTTYTYRISPVTSVGDAVGAPFIITAVTRLPVNNFRFTSKTSTSMAMAWDDTPSETGYLLERSLDNTTWTTAATLAANTTTWTDTNVSQGNEYYYRITPQNATATGQVTSPIFAAAPATALPPTWSEADVGTATGSGAAVNSLGTWTLVSSGADIAGTSDAFHFAYRTISGDTVAIAKVSSVEVTDNAAKAGLMFRESTATGSKFYALMLNAGGGFGIDSRYRTATNAQYTYQQQLATVAAPYWLKITRSGNTFTPAYSTDGVTYTNGAAVTITLNSSLLVGLANTAITTTQLNTSTFNNVIVGSTTPPTIATSATATPSPVTGTTTNLSVLGADPAGEANLTYVWSTSGTPPATVNFSANGTNAAKNSVATFTAAGSYSFVVTVYGPSGASTTSTVSVTANQTVTGITAGVSTIALGTAVQYSVADQFGAAMSSAGLTWSSTTGVITASGLFTAPLSGSSATITATGGAFSSNNTLSLVAPLAWYKADQTTGTTLTDSSGNSKTGTLTGATAFTTGKTGNALALAGGYASLPSGIVAGLTSFTISTWINLDSNPSWARIFDFGTGQTVNMFLTANPGGANNLRFAITASGGGGEQQINGTAITVGAWTHIAVTLSGGVGTLYINGAAVGTNSSMTLNPSSLGTTTLNYLGKSQYADPAYQGKIDDFRIFGSGLSAAAINALYAAWQIPTVATNALAAPSVVAGLSTNLSTLGADDGGEANLTYMWLPITLPSGASPPTYSSNGGNSSKSTSATFSRAGNYVFQVKIADATGYTATSNVSVNVQQTATTLSLSPSSPSVVVGGTQQFTASVLDQFGQAIVAPSVSWAIAAGGNSISSTGLATAGTTPGSFTVTATSGSATNSTALNVTPPTFSITNANDANAGSLRQAILDANAGPSVAGVFNFTIPGSGLQSIQLASTLPSLLNAATFNISTGSSVGIGTLSTNLFTLANFPLLTLGGGGNLTLGGSQSHTSAASLIVSAGSLVLASDAGTNVSVVANVPVTLSSSQHLASLTIGANSGAYLLGSGKVLSVGNLSLDNTATLDLAGNGLIVHATSGTQASVLATLNSKIASGYGAGPNHWNGSGINSSTASGDASHLTAVGIMPNAAGSSGQRVATFAGDAVASTDVLIRYTYFGDADLSGVVNAADYAFTDNGVNFGLFGWVNGDFNYDGTIDGADYALLDNAYNFQSGPLSGSGSTPLTLSLPQTTSDAALVAYLLSQSEASSSAVVGNISRPKVAR
jgi:hypothetical protein